MSADPGVMPLRARQIVLADWRGDVLPKEPNKLRPAVVEDDGLFASNYPIVILVPLIEDATLAIADLSVPTEPTVENECIKPSLAARSDITFRLRSHRFLAMVEIPELPAAWPAAPETHPSSESPS
jgi:hypothetical protein